MLGGETVKGHSGPQLVGSSGHSWYLFLLQQPCAPRESWQWPRCSIQAQLFLQLGRDVLGALEGCLVRPLRLLIPTDAAKNRPAEVGPG